MGMFFLFRGNNINVMKLKNRIKYWRRAFGFKTQTGFAGFIGVTTQQVNDWESHRKEPDRDTAWMIIHKLNIDMRDLFEQED